MNTAINHDVKLIQIIALGFRTCWFLALGGVGVFSKVLPDREVHEIPTPGQINYFS